MGIVHLFLISREQEYQRKILFVSHVLTQEERVMNSSLLIFFLFMGVIIASSLSELGDSETENSKDFAHRVKRSWRKCDFNCFYNDEERRDAKALAGLCWFSRSYKLLERWEDPDCGVCYCCSCCCEGYYC